MPSSTPTLFPATLAGSLPKPFWLAETNKLWPQWKSQGAELDANRQSDSVEVQINDECQLWLAPWLTQMHARTRAFRETCKILNIGLGGAKGLID